MSVVSHEVLAELADRWGPSYFLLDTDRFRSNLTRLVDAFRRWYPQSRFGYSYKTNYTPALCRIVDEMGGSAEVVSAMEYEAARRIGVDPRRIIFNGPLKSEDDLWRALCEGARVNIDSPSQIRAMEQLAPRLEEPVEVGVRVTFALEGAAPSRFGFDADANDAAEAIAALDALPGVGVRGLHCHFSTRRRSVADYRQISTKMVELSDRLFMTPPASVDIGGGFFSEMPGELAEQFSAPIPTYEEYAEAAARPFSDAFGDDGPELFIEPGVSVTADTMSFVARVVDVRRVGPRRIAVVAGSVHNIKPTLNTLDLPARAVVDPTAGDRTPGPHEVVGYTCMEHDLLHSGLDASLGEGDFVVFSNVGAYTVVMKPPFIRGAPAVLDARDFSILRRADTTEDLFGAFG